MATKNVKQYCRITEYPGEWSVYYGDDSVNHECVGPYSSALSAMNDLAKKEGWSLAQIDHGGTPTHYYMVREIAIDEENA